MRRNMKKYEISLHSAAAVILGSVLPLLGTACGPKSALTAIPSLKASSLSSGSLPALGSLPSFEASFSTESPSSSGSQSSPETQPTSACPTLPAAGERLSDFVPDGWELLDSVTLDFNRDGLTDYIGVAERKEATAQPGADRTKDDQQDDRLSPRILFAIASNGPDGYKLDFQDETLIRTQAEGGVFGDPYMPMTSDQANSFTTHFFGGSSWKWSEDFTYACKGGTWYLSAAKISSLYGPHTVYKIVNDYESGIGMRYRRSSSDLVKRMGDGETPEFEPEFDLIYEVRLDPAPTLYDTSVRWPRSSDRASEWLSASVKIMEGVSLTEAQVQFPDPYSFLGYTNNQYLLYSFQNKSSQKNYLAMYGRKDHSLTVVAEENWEIDSPTMYNGKIYYIVNLTENVSYKDWRGRTRSEDMTTAVRLCRINPDGTERQTIFEYQPEWESAPPYLSLNYEINSGEIVTEVCLSDNPHPFYRMNTDGSGQTLIGTVPR